MIVSSEITVRAAAPSDAPAVAGIYNESITRREATFETELRRAEDVRPRLASRTHPALVAERGSAVVGWAWTAPYSERPVYAGVVEASIYVHSTARGIGIGSRLARELAAAAERRGFHKLVGRLFATNAASVQLVRRCGFREVGVHRRHAKLGGRWRDVLVVELLLGDTADPTVRQPP